MGEINQMKSQERLGHVGGKIKSNQVKTGDEIYVRSKTRK